MKPTEIQQSQWITNPTSQKTSFVPPGSTHIVAVIRALLQENELDAWKEYHSDLLPRVARVTNGGTYQRIMTQFQSKPTLTLPKWVESGEMDDFWEYLQANGVVGIFPDFFGEDNAQLCLVSADLNLLGPKRVLEPLIY